MNVEVQGSGENASHHKLVLKELNESIKQASFKLKKEKLIIILEKESEGEWFDLCKAASN